LYSWNPCTVFHLYHLMCAFQMTTSRRHFSATKLSEVKALSLSPKYSFVAIPPALPSRITPIPKISLAMRPRKTTALPVALTENLDHFYEATPVALYEDEGPCNDEHCFTTPKYIVDQCSALDSPPPLRRTPADISIIPSAPSPIPERLIFPNF
jgi:hypothetical protein